MHRPASYFCLVLAFVASLTAQPAPPRSVITVPGGGGSAPTLFHRGWLGIFENTSIPGSRPRLVSVAAGDTHSVIDIPLPLDPLDGTPLVPQNVVPSSGTPLYNGLGNLTRRLVHPTLSADGRAAALCLVNQAGTRFYAAFIGSTGVIALSQIGGPTPLDLAFSPDGAFGFYAWNDPAISGRARLEVYRTGNLSAVTYVGSAPLAEPIPTPLNSGGGCDCICSNFPTRLEVEPVEGGTAFAAVPVMSGADIVGSYSTVPALVASHRYASAGRTNTNLLRLDAPAGAYDLYAFASGREIAISRFGSDGLTRARTFDVDGQSPYTLACGVVDLVGLGDPANDRAGVYVPVNGPNPADTSLLTGVMEAFIVRPSTGRLDAYRHIRLGNMQQTYFGQHSMRASGRDVYALAFDAVTGAPDTLNAVTFLGASPSQVETVLAGFYFPTNSSLAPAVSADGGTAAITTDVGQESVTMTSRTPYTYPKNPNRGSSGDSNFTSDAAAPLIAGAPVDSSVAVVMFPPPPTTVNTARVVVQRPDGAGGGMATITDVVGLGWQPAPTLLGSPYSAMIDLKGIWTSTALSPNTVEWAYSSQGGITIICAYPGLTRVDVFLARFLGPEGLRLRHSELTVRP